VGVGAIHQNPTSQGGLAPLLSIVAPLDEARKATADVVTLTQFTQPVTECPREAGGDVDQRVSRQTSHPPGQVVVAIR
jgi:hypothetical protein